MIKIVKTQEELSATLEKQRNNGISVGFVPTMGALHQGHAALVRRAKAENQLVVTSVFVNPTQFNDKKDLVNYPRTPEADAVLLEAAGCDILFLPEAAEMYPQGEMEKSPLIDLAGLDTVMEGAHRPGHFAGVVTIVKKLFLAVGKCNAYFGEKDFQQLAIVRRMTSEFQLPVNIIGCPIVREDDGLAMSSRNMRLTAEERKIAPLISQALFHAKENWQSHPASAIKKMVAAEIAKQPLMRLEYFEISDCDSLQPLDDSQKKNAVACIAVHLGNVRLIDNIILG